METDNQAVMIHKLFSSIFRREFIFEVFVAGRSSVSRHHRWRAYRVYILYSSPGLLLS